MAEASPGASGASGTVVGEDGADLYYCTGFKTFHRLTNTALGCQSTHSGGVPAAMKPNYICFWVILIGSFTSD